MSSLENARHVRCIQTQLIIVSLLLDKLAASAASPLNGRNMCMGAFDPLSKPTVSEETQPFDSGFLSQGLTRASTQSFGCLIASNDITSRWWPWDEVGQKIDLQISSVFSRIPFYSLVRYIFDYEELIVTTFLDELFNFSNNLAQHLRELGQQMNKWISFSTASLYR